MDRGDSEATTPRNQSPASSSCTSSPSKTSQSQTNRRRDPEPISRHPLSLSTRKPRYARDAGCAGALQKPCLCRQLGLPGGVEGPELGWPGAVEQGYVGVGEPVQGAQYAGEDRAVEARVDLGSAG